MDLILSVLVLGAFALLAGAFALWRRGGSRLQVGLMLVMVGVIVANIAILTIPGGDGTPPVGKVPSGKAPG